MNSSETQQLDLHEVIRQAESNYLEAFKAARDSSIRGKNSAWLLSTLDPKLRTDLIKARNDYAEALCTLNGLLLVKGFFNKAHKIVAGIPSSIAPETFVEANASVLFGAIPYDVNYQTPGYPLMQIELVEHPEWGSFCGHFTNFDWQKPARD